jgi:hypothetical protein
VGLPTEAVRNVGRGRISLDCNDPRLWGDRCRAHHWGPQESPDSTGRLSQCFIGEIMNGSKNVLSLQVARERACQAKAASDRQISKRSNQRLLERLEAENAQLRDCVGELMLEIQALHDGTK